MHGVGLPFAESAFASFGFPQTQFSVVEEQSRVPDPNFSTVKFPNPEEKGALVSLGSSRYRASSTTKREVEEKSESLTNLRSTRI
jgi:phosphomannomutase